MTARECCSGKGERVRGRMKIWMRVGEQRLRRGGEENEVGDEMTGEM